MTAHIEDSAPAPSNRETQMYREWARDAAVGLASLTPAMTAADAPVSPQLARAAQATENAWREIDAEFGLLSSTEAAQVMGYGANRTWAATKRRDGQLLGVRRGGGFRYPSFQLTPQIMPVVARLTTIARQNSWSAEAVVLWLCSPSTWLHSDQRPVDLLSSDPDAVLKAAASAMAPQW